MTAGSSSAVEITPALWRGIQFLAERQLPSGEFVVYASSSREMTHETSEPDSAVFATALIVDCLSTLACDEAEEAPPDMQRALETLDRRACEFLLAEMADPGVWAYWTSANPRVIPPDLDDTCVISSILERRAIGFPDNKDLVFAHRDAAGRFLTWMLGEELGPYGELLPSRHHDNVDPVVNVNALAYVGTFADQQPVIDFVEQAIGSGGQLEYYEDELALYYMIGRAKRLGFDGFDAARPRIFAEIEERRDSHGTLGSPLHDALAVTTVSALGAEVRRWTGAVDSILSAQRADGSWPRQPFYLGPAPFYGSENLTTAFCLEALATFRCAL